MPLEIPKSPVQHPRHRVSGFSIPGRLPVLLAVVLGLFAHQGALAQTTHTLSTLIVEAEDRGGTAVNATTSLSPDLTSSPNANAFTVTFPFDATRVTVTATGTGPGTNGWDLTVPGVDGADLAGGYERDLRSGANSIRIRATEEAPGTGTRDYTITVTRAAEIGSALETLSVSPSPGIAGVVDPLDPTFPPSPDTADPRAFKTDADLAVTRVTVTAATKPGWEAEVTYGGDPDADTGTNGYQRNLVVGANRITVRATPIGTSGPRDYTITVTQTTTPSAPGNLRATAGDRTVRLSWTAPPTNGGRFINNYQYRMKDEDEDDYSDWVTIGRPSTDAAGDDASTRLHDVGTIATRDDSGGAGTVRLVNGTTYIFQVRAVNVNQGGAASNTAEATPARPLPAPQDVVAQPGHQRVTLSWTRIPDATNSDVEDESVSGYQYRRRVGTGGWGSWTPIADSDLVESGTTRSYTVTGLTNDTTYRFQVRGRNSVGDGAASTEVEATPEAGQPGAPTNLTATAGDEQVTLSWTAPSDNGGEPITDYEYRYREQSSSYADPAVWTATGGTRTTVTVYNNNNNLTNGTTYYFQVRAVNGVDCDDDIPADPCGQASLEVSATPFGKPVTDVDLTDAVSGDRRVTLGWDPVPDPPTEELGGFQYRQKAGGDYGRWIDVRNSDASTDEHVVAGLTNGTTYTFQVRAVNSSGGGLASNELSAVPSTTPGAPTLTATAGDKEVTLTWTPPDDGGMRISSYLCQRRSGAGAYGSCTAKSISASATSLTLTDDDNPAIANDTTYTFQVRAVNGKGNGDWSKEASARPTDDASDRSYTISATIDGKSWAKAGESNPLRATVEVNPRFTAQSTSLWVSVSGAGITAETEEVTFGPTNSRRDASFDVDPTFSELSPYITVALLPASDNDPTVVNSNLDTALAVTNVEVRPITTPEPPAGLEATRGDGEVTLSWARPPAPSSPAVGYDYDYRQRRQPGSYGRWTDFAGAELQSSTVTSNTVTGFSNGGTYAFQVRAVAVDSDGRIAGAESGSSDEVTVSLSGTTQTGGLSAPRNLAAAPGNGQVTLSWTAPASDGGAAISGYQYQQRAGTGAYGQWTAIPGGPSSRSYVVTGLTNGTPYFYRARAVNSDGGGPPSAEESATPSLTVDTTLRALSLSTVTLAPAPVTLSPAFTPATRTYTAAVGSSVAQVTVTAAPNKAGATATITPADANTTAAGHQVALVVGPNPIWVSVADGTNAGVYTITVTRAGSVPAAPTGLTATADEDGEGTVTLSWTAPTGGGAVGRYEYQQRAGTGAYGAWTPIPGSGPSTTAYTVTGLSNDTAYTFRVRGVNSVGNGAASNEATATPPVRLVWAKSEQEVAAVIAAAMAVGFGDGMAFDVGEQIEIPGSALFNAAEGASLSYAAVSSDSTVASAGIIDAITVTVTAVTGGMADITITATATPPSGLTINPQTSPREASITFPVEVGLEALALTLSGPADGTNLVEGGRAVDGTAGAVTVTVTANRPVTEAVTVTLRLDRAMSTSTATADDFEAEPIVIAAGGTTGSTTVTAVEDGMAEKMEELVLFGLAAENAGPVTGEVRLRLWDAAVPALPIIAQLLLAAFLAIGGYRRYLRR